MWIIIVVILLIPVLFTLVGVMISAPKYKGPVSDHFDGKKFINPGGIQAKGLSDVLKWALTRKRAKWIELPDNYGPRPLEFNKEGFRITYVNHTTFLIQVDGLNILTDPVWSKRTSPFQWAGPKRMRQPGLRLEDLPKIHVVLLSHNHYDHLDIATMHTVFGAHHPKIITPLGVKAFLDEEKITGATDLDWWDEFSLSGSVLVQSVPAQHFSGRGSLDRDATLWCGYMLTTSAGKLYFAGDTGYNENTFKEIGQKAGEINISIIPVGAYKPRWFMSPIHVSPDEAVKIHLDVKSKVSIASHFGTFALADDSREDPEVDLKNALRDNNILEDKFVLLEEGEPRMFER
jgi:L-ascorbate metabolism protein UlaG (beta-lactamase superfamily)